MKQSFSCVLCFVYSLATGSIVAAGDDFHTQMMNATFKVANEKSTATCFLLVHPSPKDPKKEEFLLITAAHVLEPMNGEEAIIFLRRKQSEGVYQKIPHKLAIRKGKKDLWTRHPARDVAVIPFTPPESCETSKLSIDLLATDEA